MDPIRLVDQANLTEREREALAAGQRPPVEYDVGRGGERLGKALSEGAAGASVSSASVAVKLGLKLLVTAVLAALGFVASMQMTTPHARRPDAAIAPVQPLAEPPAPAPVLAPPAPEPAQPLAIPAAAPAREAAPEKPQTPRKIEAHSERLPAPRSAPAAAAPASRAMITAAEPTEVSPEPEALAPAEPREQEKPAEQAAPMPSAAMLEMKAIAQAKRALSEHEPQQALAILARTARDFPRGYFVEERRALRVLALADRGESEQARQEAASFVHDYPSGAFTARVKAAAER